MLNGSYSDIFLFPKIPSYNPSIYSHYCPDCPFIPRRRFPLPPSIDPKVAIFAPSIALSSVKLGLEIPKSSFPAAAMRVHPVPMKRNLTLLGAGVAARQRKLRRLPHVFSKVLELPFGADADVAVRESVDGFQFVAAADGVGRGVRAHAIEIHPGVMKVVIWDGAWAGVGPAFDGLELDRWRFRLPASTRPALATAEYVNGELVVTVPKGVGSDEEEDGDLRGGGIGIAQLVVAVQ